MQNLCKSCLGYPTTRRWHLQVSGLTDELDWAPFNLNPWCTLLAIMTITVVRFSVQSRPPLALPSLWSMRVQAEQASLSTTFPMEHASAGRKSPNKAPWETLGQRLSTLISAPLLTGDLSWGCKEADFTFLTQRISSTPIVKPRSVRKVVNSLASAVSKRADTPPPYNYNK